MEINSTREIFAGLPTDVAIIIFNMLGHREFAHCQEVCHRWNRDLIFLLDEIVLVNHYSLITRLPYYQESVKNFSCKSFNFVEFLYLPSQFSGDALIEFVLQLPKLVDIKLQGVTVLASKKQSPMQLLSTHKHLKSLHYGHTIAKETDISDIVGFTQLSELKIKADARILEYLWDVLLGMTKLRKLDLEVRGPSTRVAINWNALTSLNSFNLVNLSWTPFSSVEGSEISAMTNLTKLQLSGPYSADLLQPWLMKCTHLRELVVDALHKDMFSTLAMQHLTSLQCNRALRVDELVPKLPNLVALSWRPGTPYEYEFIARHVNLTCLELRGITDEDMCDKILTLTRLKQLGLHVPMTPKIADIIKKLPNLEVIGVQLPGFETQKVNYKHNFHRTFDLPNHLLVLFSEGLL